MPPAFFQTMEDPGKAAMMGFFDGQDTNPKLHVHYHFKESPKKIPRNLHEV